MGLNILGKIRKTRSIEHEGGYSLITMSIFLVVLGLLVVAGLFLSKQYS